jgi:hypothetical protein
MQKQAIDTDVVGRHAAGGALVGGGVAALVNLVHMVNQMREARAKKLAPTETDENTIVLTLPNKKGEVVSQKSTEPSSIEGPKVGDFALDRATGKSRVAKSAIKTPGAGQFGPKLCMASADKSAEGTSGWPTLTASVLAALASGVGGASIVNKLYEAQRERKLKQELDAAKQEYMDMLSGNAVKGASFIEDAFNWNSTDEKQAGAGSVFGPINYPLAAMAIMTILGSGTTGYLTKKVLDEKLKETNDKSLDVPKVKRIVFKSQPEQDTTKIAEDYEREAVAAGLLVMMDNVEGSYRFTSDPEVKTAMSKDGTTKESLVKEANDWDTLTTHLEGAPDLRRALYGLYTRYTSNPVSGFFKRMALKIPAVRRHADQKLYGALDGLRNGSIDIKSHLKTASVGVPGKALSTVAGSLFGGMAGTQLLDDDLTPDELAKLIVAAQEQAEQNKALKDSKVPGTVRVEAGDPGAHQYIANNKRNIQAVIKRLASEGQL